MKYEVYFQDGVPTYTEIDPLVLYEMYKAVMNGHAAISIIVNVGKLKLYLNIRHLDAERTFSRVHQVIPGSDSGPPPAAA